MVVFTKSDKLLESKTIELQEEYDSLVGEDLEIRIKKEVEKVHDTCERSLEKARSRMDPPIPELRHVKVSGIISRSFLISVSHGRSLSQTVRAMKIPSSPSLQRLGILSVTSSG